MNGLVGERGECNGFAAQQCILAPTLRSGTSCAGSIHILHRMHCTVERQLSVAIENQPGRLAAICATLAAHKINIRNLSVVDNIEQGMIRLVPSDPTLCRKLLVEQGLYVVEAEVMVVILKDWPGELGRLSEALASAHINIEYAYGTEDSSEKEMRLVLKVSQIPKAVEILRPL